jgi:hypothetical protein
MEIGASALLTAGVSIAAFEGATSFDLIPSSGGTTAIAG